MWKCDMKELFFQLMEKKWEKKERKDKKKNKMNEFIYYDGWGTKYE